MTDPTHAKRAAQEYLERVSTTAADLHRLADRFEREGRTVSDTAGVAGVPRYTEAAVQSLHALFWGLANAAPYSIVTRAAQADEAERAAAQAAGDVRGS